MQAIPTPRLKKAPVKTPDKTPVKRKRTPICGGRWRKEEDMLLKAAVAKVGTKVREEQRGVPQYPEHDP